jgi:hypothetical protein
MKTRTTLCLALAAALLTGCPRRAAHGRTDAKEKPDIVKMREDTLRDAAQKRAAWGQKLKSMNPAELAAELSAESEKGREPFNSMAFAEAVHRGEAAAPALAATITRDDRASLLTLLAVRSASRTVYDGIAQPRRVAIMVDALRTSPTFNTWGLPHVKWEYAAQSLVGEGEAAARGLTPLLADKRAAPSWGGEDRLEYLAYKYRVCDYAWALITSIHQQKVELARDPAARDRLISATTAAKPR